MTSPIRKALAAVLETRDQLDESARHAAVPFITLHGAALMTMVALQSGPFLTAFLLEVGGSEGQVALLTSFVCATQVLQVAGLGLVSRVRRRRALAMALSLGHRACWVAICLVPFVVPSGRIPLILALMLTAEGLSALANPAWSSLMHDAVPAKVRGAVLARRRALGLLGALLATGLGGFAIQHMAARWGPGWVAYPPLFAAGVALGVGAVAVLVRIPERTLPDRAPPELAAQLRRPLDDPRFRAVLRFNAAWSFAVGVASPFFLLYLLRRLEVPLAAATLLTVVSQLANVACLQLFGRLADRASCKLVLWLACPMFLASLLLWPVVSRPDFPLGLGPGLALIYLLSGASLAGVSVASNSLALALAPTDEAAEYLTVHGLVSAGAGMLGPLVGTAVAAAVPGAGLGMMTGVRLGPLEVVFTAAATLGALALVGLRSIDEEGEIEDRDLFSRVLGELTAPFRGFSPLPGSRGLVTASTLAGAARLARSSKPAGKATEPDPGQGHDPAPKEPTGTSG